MGGTGIDRGENVDEQAILGGISCPCRNNRSGEVPIGHAVVARWADLRAIDDHVGVRADCFDGTRFTPSQRTGGILRVANPVILVKSRGRVLKPGDFGIAHIDSRSGALATHDGGKRDQQKRKDEGEHSSKKSILRKKGGTRPFKDQYGAPAIVAVDPDQRMGSSSSIRFLCTRSVRFVLQFVVRHCPAGSITVISLCRRSSQVPHDEVWRNLCGGTNTRPCAAPQTDNFGSKRSPVAYPAFFESQLGLAAFAIGQRLRGKGELFLGSAIAERMPLQGLRTHGKS